MVLGFNFSFHSNAIQTMLFNAPSIFQFVQKFICCKQAKWSHTNFLYRFKRYFQMENEQLEAITIFTKYIVIARKMWAYEYMARTPQINRVQNGHINLDGNVFLLMKMLQCLNLKKKIIQNKNNNSIELNKSVLNSVCMCVCDVELVELPVLWWCRPDRWLVHPKLLIDLLLFPR